MKIPFFNRDREERQVEEIATKLLHLDGVEGVNVKSENGMHIFNVSGGNIFEVVLILVEYMDDLRLTWNHLSYDEQDSDDAWSVVDRKIEEYAQTRRI